MHSTLATIQGQLRALIAQIQRVVPNDEPLNVAHASWNLPGLTRAEFIEEAQTLIDLIDSRGAEDIQEATDVRLKDYGRRLEFLLANSVGQLWGGNGGQAASAYMLTLTGLQKALVPALTRDGHAEAVTTLRSLTTKLRGMEAKLNGLEPRTASLATMVERIEHAYNAADQLPTDLESLSEARKKIEDLFRNATKNHGQLADIKENADEFDKQLKQSVEDAKRVLEQCETAYSAATSVGLAAAFTERSSALSQSMWFWVAGLVVALVAGSHFGSVQLQTLSELFKQPNVTTSVVILNLILSMLSVGAPIWFGWLATKQIGQRFRLAEDYAFKASISRAYEGFRREAARVDKNMEARLLASALTRLDELPLRLIETDTHGSPWHELASSDLVKDAMRAVPGFAGQVQALASKAIDAVTPAKAKSQLPSAADSAD
jgi:phage shock protein A